MDLLRYQGQGSELAAELQSEHTFPAAGIASLKFSSALSGLLLGVGLLRRDRRPGGLPRQPLGLERLPVEGSREGTFHRILRS
jgi:hypothetical protein